jgi:hypothetical protein
MRMEVANLGFLLERLGRDCDDLQFLREITQNSIQANAKTIVWDVDWLLHEQQGIYKITCIDDGVGMSPEELEHYINHLSASQHLQTHDGNFGVGAKVAAATRNPNGVIYQSWKNGQGAMIQLWKDPETDEYGLRQFSLPNGTFSHHVPLSDAAKPAEIGASGTKVTLLGRDPEHNTMQAPEGVPTPSRWITRHLNARYFRFPDGVEVKAREGWEADRDAKSNLLRVIRGQENFLDRFSDQRGAVDIGDAVIHWWILSDAEERRSVSELVNTSHFATLFQDELYEMKTGRAGTARLQQFGVIFGHDRVVLYAEPKNGPTRPISSNTARTQLLIDGQELPYADWAHAFREQMPQEIKELMEAVISHASSESHRDSIADRLSNYARLYQLSRWRRNLRGEVRVSDPTLSGTLNGERGTETEEPKPPARPRKAHDPIGAALAGMLADAGQLAQPEQVSNDFPTVRWLSLSDGTRAEGDIEDRAARFISEDNIIQANADFRVFTDMTDYWCDEYGLGHGNKIVTDVVHEWFEQALVETVIGCQSLQGERMWNLDDIRKALSEESLTAAVMQRYHVANSVKRTLGARLGSLRERATASASGA